MQKKVNPTEDSLALRLWVHMISNEKLRLLHSFKEDKNSSIKYYCDVYFSELKQLFLQVSLMMENLWGSFLFVFLR